MDYSKFEDLIQYKFKNISLLEQALTHRSYAGEYPGIPSYERLEFLGDAVLGMICCNYLYEKYPEYDEGKLSYIKTNLVCRNSLADCGKKMNLGEYIRLGRSELMNGGKERPALFEDVMEAITAAIYLDGGYDHAKRFVETFVLIGNKSLTDKSIHSKTSLQELVQARGKTVSYKLVFQRGPAHDPWFESDVIIDGRRAGHGGGRSKKISEQNAAIEALAKLENGEICI